MALKLKLANLGLSTDGTAVTVQDQTGAYNGSTNPGGYGTPNPAVPSLVLLRWKMFLTTAWGIIAGIYSQSDIAAGLLINSVGLGLGSGLLPDGVEQVQYLAGYALSGGNVTLVPNSTVVTLNSVVITGLQVGMYVSFGAAINSVYMVTAIGDTAITLDCPYTGTLTSDTMKMWYSTILNILVQTFGNQAINDRLVRFEEEQITDEELMNLTKLTMSSMAAAPKFASGDLLGANDIAINVQNKCLSDPRQW